VRIAAAISLREALTQIAADFEKVSGIKVELVFGSSGQLLAQIRNGAPVDAFISAAREQVDVLEGDGLTLPDTRQVIVGNALVLIVPADRRLGLQSFQDLARGDVRRVAIGEPATVPAGQYALQVFEKLKLVESLRGRLVYGTNARQVLDYVARGEVAAGVVYATDARTEKDRVTVVATADAAWHEPIAYPAVVLRAAAHADAAKRFLAQLAGPEAAAVFTRCGFALPRRPTTQPVEGASPAAASGPAAESGVRP
jgi:molybdate transport system substrate-binding protein